MPVKAKQVVLLLLKVVKSKLVFKLKTRARNPKIQKVKTKVGERNANAFCFANFVHKQKNNIQKSQYFYTFKAPFKACGTSLETTM